METYSNEVLRTLFDTLPNMVLSPEEASLFIKLAIGYGADVAMSTLARSRLHIAHDILTVLWRSLGRLPDYSYEITNVKIVTLSNYTKNLYMLGEHEHAIELCDRGIELCKRFWDGQHLPIFMAGKADNLIKLGQIQAGTQCLHKACLLFEGNGQIRDLQLYREIYADLFCET